MYYSSFEISTFQNTRPLQVPALQVRSIRVRQERGWQRLQIHEYTRTCEIFL